MLSLIEKLPVELVGMNVLGNLSLKDITMLGQACGSKITQQLLCNLLSYCPPVTLASQEHATLSALEWLAKRQCKVSKLTIQLPGTNPCLHVKNLQVEHFELKIGADTTMEDLTPLKDNHLGCNVKSITIHRDQNKEVMKQISACTRNVKQLTIAYSHNCMDWLTVDILSRWNLTEIEFNHSTITTTLILRIVQTCSELTSIKLYSGNIDDSAVSAIAQHCHQLEKLVLLRSRKITWTSLVSLSERGLPLKELVIARIPNIPTTDIARRCSHALSCIRNMDTYNLYHISQQANVLMPYMTQLTSVFLEYYDPSYIPLLTQYCHKLTKLIVYKRAYTVEDIHSIFANPLLQELYYGSKPVFTDTILIELIHACPHLHTFWLSSETNITDTGIVALSEHCPQTYK